MPYEILSVSPIRNATGKCSWLAIYCGHNRMAIPSQDIRSAIRTIVVETPTSSSETMSGYSSFGGVDYVFVVWKNHRCNCTFFNVPESLMNPPGTDVVNGLPDWFAEVRPAYFKLANLHVAILESPVVISKSQSLAFLTAAGANIFHCVVCVNQSIYKRYAVAAALGTVALVMVGISADTVKNEMLSFLSFYGLNAEAISICLVNDESMFEDMDYNDDQTIPFPTAEEAKASKKHSDQVRCLLDVFKNYEAQLQKQSTGVIQNSEFSTRCTMS
ncbi:hypothetical protein HA402_000923 [Bradysia odoriphaga]|nr:hypothetical protein HA402_000923 [Bradysia odoriphaga]